MALLILAELALSAGDREFPGSGNGFRPRERLTGIFDTPRPEGAGILVSQSLLDESRSYDQQR